MAKLPKLTVCSFVIIIIIIIVIAIIIIVIIIVVVVSIIIIIIIISVFIIIIIIKEKTNGWRLGNCYNFRTISENEYLPCNLHCVWFRLQRRNFWH